MSPFRSDPSNLYDQDYYAWVQEQVRVLRERRTEEVDWENVAEELDDLGKSEKWSIESHLETLIEHLLKLGYTRSITRERNSRLWQGTVKLARSKIRRRLAQSPSLRGKIPELFASAYEDGRTKMLARTKLPDNAIPASCPWTLDQVLDDGFVPRAAD
ncbi:MAG TPA: DUF29 domain-containing protein [Candidatus Binataceae bacterium]|nr:DUF29 domain-containing protein [Candidatus Binataceae bacterium]